MVAASLEQVRQELADRVNTIGGLYCYADSPPNPKVPAFGIIGPVRWQYNVSMSDDWVLVFEGWLFVSPQDLVRAQQALNQWLAPLGAKSVKLALESVEVTPGILQSVRVIGGPRPFAKVVGENVPEMLTAMVEVEVYPEIE